MVPRLSVVFAVGAVACASLAGCRDAEPVAAPVTPSRYISAVQELLDPPARLAAMISQATDADPAPAPTRRRLDDLVARARARLLEFRALRLDDATLRRQRDRLAGAYALLIPRMQTAADSLRSDDRAGVARAADPFLDSLRTLPSAAASSASR
jgi:hypothetical protein